MARGSYPGPNVWNQMCRLPTCVVDVKEPPSIEQHVRSLVYQTTLVTAMTALGHAVDHN